MTHIPLGIKTSIIRHSIGGAAIGVPGAFAAHGDVAFLSLLWSKMIYTIADKSGAEMDKKTIFKIAATVGAAAGTASAGVKIANTYFAATGVGTPFAMAANASANGVATYLIGNTAANFILKNNLDPADIIRGVLGALSIPLGDVAAEKVDELVEFIAREFDL